MQTLFAKEWALARYQPRKTGLPPSAVIGSNKKSLLMKQALIRLNSYS